MKLVVGLGNPGRRYQNTRHNVGFRVVDQLAARGGAGLGRGRLGAEGEVTIDGERVRLLQPYTYMNLSGPAVAEALRRSGLSPADLLVVCDDINLPLGQIRLRREGGPGGHQGLASIIRSLRAEQFARLRVGVDSPPPGMEWAEYVLRPVPAGLRRKLDEAVWVAADAVEVWAKEGIEQAMNRFNARREPPGA